MLRRQRRPAETVCAIELFEPLAAAPTMALADPKCPTFTVLQGLVAKGWARTSGLATHALECAECKVFCAEKMEVRKPHFHTLL